MTPTMMSRNLPPDLGRRLLAWSAALGVVALLATGCAKKGPTPLPAPPSPTTTTPSTTPTTPPKSPDTTPAVPNATLKDLRTVYFGLDSSLLDDAAKAALDLNSKLLRDNSSWSVKLEGNCDERGTVEYNQALGQRRAEAVRDYLVGAGVDTGRLKTISYGKENPAVQGDGEEVWAKNRRVDFSKS